MLLGGGLSAYYVTRKYNWDGWKIGDMIAPALVLFQTITFLGIWAATRQIQFIAIALALLSLYMGMQFLKSKKYWGNSSLFFQMKRLNKSIITGGLLAIYLTGSSAIAILFLVTYRNFDSNFWKFQIIFYLLILFVSLILVRRQLSKQKTYMAPKLTKDFLSGIKDKLQKRKSEIQSELETLEKTDPFLQDFRDDGQRFELTDMGDQATDILQRETNDMQEDVLNLELKSINQALTKIEKGTYGIDEKTGKEISKKRLEAYPTATTDIDNE